MATTANKLKILLIPREYPTRANSLKGIFIKGCVLAMAFGEVIVSRNSIRLRMKKPD
ncbi:MAG: hypothetical protein AABZ32_06820 [Bacteroidota bacterium]